MDLSSYFSVKSCWKYLQPGGVLVAELRCCESSGDFNLSIWLCHVHMDVQLAAGESTEPFFLLHFLGSLAPIEPGTVAEDKSCIHCTNRVPKQQYTDSFFALCENWGGLYSLPLCWCLSTALFEARPIVPANVSYWPNPVPAMFPGSKWRARECLKRGNHRANAFCCIVIWPIKSKLWSMLMQTGNYVVTAAAIDIWLPPQGGKMWFFFCYV